MIDVDILMISILLVLTIIVCIIVYLNRSVPQEKTKTVVVVPKPISVIPPINKDLNPIVVIPGLGGTNLDYTLDNTFVSSLNGKVCSKEVLDNLEEIQPSLWINPLGLLLKKDCFLDMLKPVYDKENKTLENLQGLNVFPSEKYIGDPHSSICLGYLLNSDKCYPLTEYSKNFVNFFIGKGYTPGYNLFIPGYDFRLVPYKEHMTKYFNSIQNLIEKIYDVTGRKIHLIGHSLGTMLANMFLNKMKKSWKKCYIADFIPISPSYDGAPKSLRTCLSGYDFGLPAWIQVTNNDFAFPQRNMAGLAATIPLLPEMYGEVNTKKENFPGNGVAVATLMSGKEVVYNVNDYKNGIVGLIRHLSKDVNEYTGNPEYTKYLDTLTDIMIPIAKEKEKYAYSDPNVKVYQIIVQPVSTEVGYLYDVSKGFRKSVV